MAKCVKLQRKKTQVCVGNMNKFIEIYVRNIQAPLNSLGLSPDYREDFTILYSLWALVETPRGKVTFDAVGIDKVISTIFYIYAVPNITAQNWIVYDANRYDIVRVTNLEENKLFLKLETVLRGSTDKDASQA